MRRIGSVFALSLLVGCSSAGDLPLGGPYGGGASGIDEASDAAVVFNLGSGSGASSGIVISSSSVGAQGTSQTSGPGSSGTSTSSSSGIPASSSTQSASTSSSSAASSSAAAPTWTYLYNTYLASGSTPGNCDGSCHRHSQCDNPSDCYSWIGSRVSNGAGLLSWDQGYMPPGGPSSLPQAEADFNAWAAAGSQDN